MNLLIRTPILLQRCRLFIQSRQSVQSRSISIFKKARTLSSHFRQPFRRRMNPDGPLVWIDCEMTGLNFRTDRLLEIAVIITDSDLKPVDEGVEYVIQTEKHILDGMDEWCIKHHGQSGLTRACLESPFTMEEVSQRVLQYIQKWVPTKRTGLLAGNSVHSDKMFLIKAMPDLIDWLHYRIVDVSSIKELSRRWYGKSGVLNSDGEIAHRALDDIRHSIEELQWYRENIFVKPSCASRDAGGC